MLTRPTRSPSIRNHPWFGKPHQVALRHFGGGIVLTAPRRHPPFQRRLRIGKVENANISRRFGLVPQAAKSPAKQLQNDLIAQGWDGQSKVIVLSDGGTALPNLVRRAVQGPVTHILDWWHVSMRVQHIENAVRGLLQTKEISGWAQLFERPAERRRWYLWHGKVMTAATLLKVLAIDCNRLRAETKDLREAASRVKARGQDLCSYLSNNFDALANYAHRYRNGLAVLSSRAEGCVSMTSGTPEWANGGACDSLRSERIASPSHGPQSLTAG